MAFFKSHIFNKKHTILTTSSISPKLTALFSFLVILFFIQIELKHLQISLFIPFRDASLCSTELILEIIF
jgi:hypothetical protein